MEIRAFPRHRRSPNAGQGPVSLEVYAERGGLLLARQSAYTLTTGTSVQPRPQLTHASTGYRVCHVPNLALGRKALRELAAVTDWAQGKR